MRRVLHVHQVEEAAEALALIDDAIAMFRTNPSPTEGDLQTLEFALSRGRLDLTSVTLPSAERAAMRARVPRRPPKGIEETSAPRPAEPHPEEYWFGRDAMA